MSDHLKLHTDRGDDDVTRGLRELYAAPADDGYWRSLEARVTELLPLTRRSATMAEATRTAPAPKLGELVQ